MRGNAEAEIGDTEGRDLEIRHEETVELRDTYRYNFDGQLDALTGDAKIFKEQVDNLQADLASFKDLCDRRRDLLE